MLRHSITKPGIIWQVLKDLIGQDLSKVSLPVFLNEPITILQKGAEIMSFCEELFCQAINE